MFPNAHSRIIRNEAGEVLGWDNPTYDEPSDPDWDWEDAMNEAEDRMGYPYDEEEPESCPNCGAELEEASSPGHAGTIYGVVCKTCDYRRIEEETSWYS